MRLSRFTPCGHLRFSSEKPRGLVQYEALAAEEGDWLSGEDGPAEAERFATAMMLATVELTLTRAGRQWDARYAQEFLPDLEDEKGIVPPRGASLAARRALLVARQRATPTAQLGSVTAALRAILGDLLVGVRPASDWGATVYPDLDGWYQLWAEESAQHSAWKVLSADVNTHTVRLQYLGGHKAALQPGVTFIIGAGLNGRSGILTVTTADYWTTGGVYGCTVVCNNYHAHDPGELVLTGKFPFWCSDQRHWTVAVAPSVLANPELLRRVNEEMGRLLRQVSSWQVVSATSTTIPAFTIGEPSIGLRAARPIIL